MQTARLMVLLVGVVGCGRGAGDTEARSTTPTPADEAEVVHQPTPVDAQPGIDSGPPLSEAAARAVLAERFRAAGLRIVQDIRITAEGIDLTLDGYDPRKRIGFEYVAEAERDTDLVASEREALAKHPGMKVLVLDAADHATVLARADAFLAATIELPDAGQIR